jgi:hypothetical protein
LPPNFLADEFEVGMTPTFDYRAMDGSAARKKIVPANEFIKSTVDSFRTPILKLSNSSYELQQNVQSEK